ncbi:hypothetical protein ACHAWC_008747 [Mediolabrus comicus]
MISMSSNVGLSTFLSSSMPSKKASQEYRLNSSHTSVSNVKSLSKPSFERTSPHRSSSAGSSMISLEANSSNVILNPSSSAPGRLSIHFFKVKQGDLVQIPPTFSHASLETPRCQFPNLLQVMRDGSYYPKWVELVVGLSRQHFPGM